jgi:hypothetical protein
VRDCEFYSTWEGKSLKLRQAILVVALLAVAGVLAHLHVAAQSYYPVARVFTPDGFTYTIVQTVRDERSACGAANSRFLDPVKGACKDCKVIYARCERKLESDELELSKGYGERNHMVVSPGLHMKVEGPPEKARAVCDQIAADMTRLGYQSAACIYPRGTPAG